MPKLPKQEFRQLIAVACTDDALRQLLDLLAGVSKYRKVYDAMTLLSGQWQELDERVRLNLLSFKETSTDRTRINHAVLQYLNELPEEIELPKSKTPAREALLRQTVQAIAADETWEYDLFFSFSSKDIDSARVFCHRLRGQGLRVFFSADDLRERGGHNFGDVIDRALRQSRHFLLFCSPNAMESRWVKIEHETFFDNFHVPNERERGFYLAEGPGFRAELVPMFYRRIQRILQPEDLLHTLVGNLTPVRVQLSESSKLSESWKATPAEEHAWEFTTDAHTPAAYEKFRLKFPQGFYAPEAQARLEAFEADEIAWEFATDHPTEKSIQKYLNKYPQGLHADEAKVRLVANEQLRELEAKKRLAEEAQKNDPFHHLMIPIKGGTFEMGDTFGEGFDSEKPVHKVTVPDFQLCKYPVTQAQWKQIMGDNPSHFKGEDLPVEMVSWNDVQVFLDKLHEETGKKYRLPSEAEWEFAAREGGEKVRFGNGKDTADPKAMNFNASKQYKQPYSLVGEYRQKTTPVSQFKANAFGLHDMSGNVWEWCEDDWHDDYKGAPSDGSSWVDSPRSAGRVFRGGGRTSDSQSCRATYRYYTWSDNRDSLIGIRLALSPQFSR